MPELIGNLESANLVGEIRAASASIEVTIAGSGPPGHTPVKGVDYWTTAEQNVIKEEAKSAIVSECSDILDEAHGYANAAQAAEINAQSVVSHAPYPSDKGTWMVWNVAQGKYVDSGNPLGLAIEIAAVTTLDATATPYVTNEGTAERPKFHLYIPRGLTGEQGDSISNIARTSGTGAPGTYDTYTITTTSGATFTFKVYNGKNGDGSGDMLSKIYDPNKQNTDIFAYADGKASTAESNAKNYTYSKSEIDNKVSNAGKVKTVNGNSPDANGNVTITVASEVTEQIVSNWGFAKATGVVTQASINDNGVIVFKNSDNADLFTLQLPLYSGGNDIGEDLPYLTSETDPTVPAWAKNPNPPSYTASDVHARSDTWVPTLTDIDGLDAHVNSLIDAAISNAIGGEY